MKQKDLSLLTDDELLLELRTVKSSNIISAVLFGVMIGVAIYSSAKNGLGILTFFPLFFIPMALKKRTYKKAIEQVIKERNLII